jgi:hypothetical protein
MPMDLAEIDLGNGTNYNPQEALNMYLPNRIVLSGEVSLAEGDMNPGKVPIQEIHIWKWWS